MSPQGAPSLPSQHRCIAPIVLLCVEDLIYKNLFTLPLRTNYQLIILHASSMVLCNLSFSPFLRATGLDALNASPKLLNLFSNSAEVKKPIANHSLSIALQRCFIHLIPSVVSITIITINFKGYFIGAELSGLQNTTHLSLAVLQIIAKIQELLIVASTANIIYHQIRHDLTSQRGIPFGLISSGISFTQLSYYWSPAYLAAVTRKSHWRLHCLLVVSGLLAATAGPATAVLLLPRLITYSVGETTFFINGSTNMLWPQHVQLDHYNPKNTSHFNPPIECANGNAYTSAVCPGGGYLSLYTFLLAHSLHTEFGIHEISDIGQAIRQPAGLVPVLSPRNSVAPFALSGRPGIPDRLFESYAYGTHGAIANYQYQLNLDWKLAASQAGKYGSASPTNRYQYYATQESIVRSQIPAVRVVCARGKVATENSTIFQFPALHNAKRNVQRNGSLEDVRNIDIDPTIRLQPTSRTRVTFLDLSNALGNREMVINGVLIETPWDIKKGSRVVVGCALDTRWADGILSIKFPSPCNGKPFNQENPSDAFGDFFLSEAPINWTRASFDDAWLKAVDFELPASAPGYQPDRKLTSMGALIEAADLIRDPSFLTAPDTEFERNNRRKLEFVVAIVFADAMSRVGSYRSWDGGSGIDDNWRLLYYNYSFKAIDVKKWSRALMPEDLGTGQYQQVAQRQYISGYGYQIGSTSDYLALTVLLIHLIIAGTYTIYVLLITQQTSACWDTFSELIALAQQSSPSTQALKNTCAGIRNFSTHGKMARVQTQTEISTHLELVFDFSEEAGEFSPVKLSREYGD